MSPQMDWPVYDSLPFSDVHHPEPNSPDLDDNIEVMQAYVSRLISEGSLGGMRHRDSEDDLDFDADLLARLHELGLSDLATLGPLSVVPEGMTSTFMPIQPSSATPSAVSSPTCASPTPEPAVPEPDVLEQMVRLCLADLQSRPGGIRRRNELGIMLREQLGQSVYRKGFVNHAVSEMSRRGMGRLTDERGTFFALVPPFYDHFRHQQHMYAQQQQQQMGASTRGHRSSNKPAAMRSAMPAGAWKATAASSAPRATMRRTRAQAAMQPYACHEEQAHMHRHHHHHHHHHHEGDKASDVDSVEGDHSGCGSSAGASSRPRRWCNFGERCKYMDDMEGNMQHFRRFAHVCPLDRQCPVVSNISIQALELIPDVLNEEARAHMSLFKHSCPNGLSCHLFAEPDRHRRHVETFTHKAKVLLNNGTATASAAPAVAVQHPTPSAFQTPPRPQPQPQPQLVGALDMLRMMGGQQPMPLSLQQALEEPAVAIKVVPPPPGLSLEPLPAMDAKARCSWPSPSTSSPSSAVSTPTSSSSGFGSVLGLGLGLGPWTAPASPSLSGDFGPFISSFDMINHLGGRAAGY